MRSSLANKGIISPFVFAALLFVIVGSSCQLTNANVTGKWTLYKDTLFINPDNSFRLVKVAANNPSNPYIVGRWHIYKKVLTMTFSDTTQDLGGGCRSLQRMWTKHSKTKLFKPRTCKTPTHEFVAFEKIE